MSICGHRLVATAGFWRSCGAGWSTVATAGGVLPEPVEEVFVGLDPTEEVLVADDSVFVAFDPDRDVAAGPSGSFSRRSC